MGCKYTIITVLSLFLALNAISQPIVSKKINKVVIDAGHGGKDPGAIGSFSKEKDIALAVALKTGEYIKETYPDVKVVYTRSDDRFIELFQRSKVANKEKADLFISIHCNSNTRKEASGSEFWVLGLHKADENLEVAKKENAVVNIEGNVTENYGFDPNTPEGNILMTMRQSLYLDKSIQFAKSLEKSIEVDPFPKNRGTKQAGFVVLYQSSMPSVLIELGFISNPKEEEYLNSEKGQMEISKKISKAFGEYKSKFEVNNGSNETSNDVISKENTASNSEVYNFKNSRDAANTAITKVEPKEVASTIKNSENKVKSRLVIEDEDLKPINTEEKSSKEIVSKEYTGYKSETPTLNAVINSNDKKEVPASVLLENTKKKVIYLEDDIQQTEPIKAVSEEKPKEVPVKVIPTDLKKNTIEKPTFVKNETVKSEIISNTKVIDNKFKSETTTTPKTDFKLVPKLNTKGLIYKVQLKAGPLQIENPIAYFKNVNNIEESFEDNYYKYLSGEYLNLNDVKAHQLELKSKGYTDCFIVKYQNGVRVK